MLPHCLYFKTTSIIATFKKMSTNFKKIGNHWSREVRRRAGLCGMALWGGQRSLSWGKSQMSPPTPVVKVRAAGPGRQAGAGEELLASPRGSALASPGSNHLQGRLAAEREAEDNGSLSPHPT